MDSVDVDLKTFPTWLMEHIYMAYRSSGEFDNEQGILVIIV
jgi:hypothetical protein